MSWVFSGRRCAPLYIPAPRAEGGMCLSLSLYRLYISLTLSSLGFVEVFSRSLFVFSLRVGHFASATAFPLRFCHSMPGFRLHSGVFARSYFSLRFFDISSFTRAACLATRLRFKCVCFFSASCAVPRLHLSYSIPPSFSPISHQLKPQFCDTHLLELKCPHHKFPPSSTPRCAPKYPLSKSCPAHFALS